MAERNLYLELAEAPAADRKQIAEQIYDGRYAEGSIRVSGLPPKRRMGRILRYKSIIGSGHDRILELACGAGDLTYALIDCADKVIGTDISAKAIEIARARSGLWRLTDEELRKIEFRQMSAVELQFPDGVFDWAISTSMVEHLHPEDVDTHLREVLRILKPSGQYLIWCPNGLGHHGHQDQHLTMLSYAEWIDKLKKAGFRRFRSTLTSRLPLVDARWKILLEAILSSSHVKVMWSHLGVRNVLLVAMKQAALAAGVSEPGD